MTENPPQPTGDEPPAWAADLPDDLRTRVIESVAELESTGQSVTVAAVRTMTRGSQNLITAALRSRREALEAQQQPSARERVARLVTQVMDAAETAVREDVQAELASMRAEVEQAQADVDAAEQMVTETRDALKEAEAEIRRLRGQADAQREALAVAHAEVDATRARITDLTTALDIERARVTQLLTPPTGKATR